MVNVSNLILRNPLAQLLQELAAKPWKRRITNAVTSARGAVDSARAHPLLDAAQWKRAVNASVRAGLDEMPRPPKPEAPVEDASVLTARIEQALRLRRPADALDASARLLDLTPADERACELRGRVLAAAGHEGAALALIAAWTKRHGERKALSAAVATISEQQGRVDDAERAYAATLTERPNDVDTLDRWLALRRARGGMEGYLAALKHIAAVDGAWRARLLLGRWCLERGDGDRARQLYAQG
nr:hypothetical protein [Planctomycetota bacterium]